MSISDAQFIDWLKSETAQRCMLVEAKYYNSGELTEYMASMPYVSKPTDTPANQPYDDVILDTPRFSCSLSDALQGYTVPTWGDIIIDNSLFTRDAWLEYGWDGRAVAMLFGDPAWPRADFRPILTGTISGISVQSSSQIKMSIKDRQWLLNVPVQKNLVGDPVLVSGLTYKVSDASLDYYDSDNNLVPGTIYAVYDNGVLIDPLTYTTSPSTSPATFTLTVAPVGILSADYTGGPASTGDVLPLCYGEVYNITPKCLSTALLTYQVHDGPISEIVQVRDGGVPIAHEKDLDNGKFTLLSNPVGTVTCDIRGATSGDVFVEGIGRIIHHIILNHSDITADDIDYDSLAAFVNLCGHRAGIYIDSRRNTLDVLDELIKSVGGWYAPGRNGKLRFGRIDPPSGTPDIELTADDIVFGTLKIARQSIPWRTARLAYLRNGTPQTDTHGSVSDYYKTLYAQEWQYCSAANPAIKTNHLLALEPDSKPTCLVDQLEAQVESARLLALNGVVRTTYTADVTTLPLTIDVGGLARLTHPRYGLSSGKLLHIIGINESIINRRVTLTLWG